MNIIASWHQLLPQEFDVSDEVIIHFLVFEEEERGFTVYQTSMYADHVLYKKRACSWYVCKYIHTDANGNPIFLLVPYITIINPRTDGGADIRPPEVCSR